MDHSEILERAKALAERERPNASAQKKAAFANSVAYLLTGASGGYGGPSIREHAVSWQLGGKSYSFEEAAELLLAEDGLIFGPLTEFHRQVWEAEYCHDDDPEDIRELESA